MAMWLLLAMTLAVQDSSIRHVRTTEGPILTLINDGLARSETFRSLVKTLDHSDVIVYVVPKLTRRALGGFLVNNVVVRGEWRYLRVAVEFQGARNRLIPLVAHELQHAVEIAQHPEVRDAASLERLFTGLAIKFGCGGTTCYETQAAKDIEWTVSKELKAVTSSPPSSDRESSPTRHFFSSAGQLTTTVITLVVADGSSPTLMRKRWPSALTS
jgi:hypothetical protein